MTPKELSEEVELLEMLEETELEKVTFEVEWPGGSGLNNEQLAKIFEYEKAGMIKKICAPGKWIYSIIVLPIDAIWLLEFIDKQQKIKSDKALD